MGDAVLVAGGTGALGAGVLRVLVDAGRPVTATYLEERERERVEAEFGAAVPLIRADLMDAGEVEDAVGAVEDLGAVVNLVGGFKAGPKVHETSVADWDELLTLNLRPGFLLARAAMPRLIAAGGGAYVGVSARPALKPFAGAAAYVTSKAAVIAFVQALDADYRAEGIRANCVLPSVIDTPANRASMPGSDFAKWVAPEAIGRVIGFLVSGDSAVTSGAAIPVYGRA
ncbi:MAG: SDR family NAD(P)-dependent oxidoreductase [Thermoleophilaceae bacterium]|nr:SDR family NAD(P)-dependent oxidoreductase [Thermoleophilaceae bacterium]